MTHRWAHLTEVGTVAALERSLTSSRVEAVVIEFWSTEPTAIEATVRHLRRDYPSVPVILYCRSRRPWRDSSFDWRVSGWMS